MLNCFFFNFNSTCFKEKYSCFNLFKLIFSNIHILNFECTHIGKIINLGKMVCFYLGGTSIFGHTITMSSSWSAVCPIFSIFSMALSMSMAWCCWASSVMWALWPIWLFSSRWYVITVKIENSIEACIVVELAWTFALSWLFFLTFIIYIENIWV